MLPSPHDLVETFDLLPDWEARYGYLIDLGRMLPPMEDALKTDDVLVPGCTSRVWVVVEEKKCHPGQAPQEREPGPSSDLVAEGPGSPLRVARDDTLYRFHIASDAAIVQGLCAVVMCFVQDQTAAVIHAVDFKEIFQKLHLEGHLSPNRRNGFFAMIERIKQLAD
jgi:cysteine desulfuration protein SufE